MNDSSSRHVFTIVSVAMLLLLLLQAVPWGKFTDNRIKDFNLFADVVSPKNIVEVEIPDIVDTDDVEIVETAESSTPADITEVSEATMAADESVLDATLKPLASGVTPGTIENYGDGAPLTHFAAALEHAGSQLVRVAIIGDSFIEGDIMCQDLRKAFQAQYGGQGVGYMAMHTEFPGFRKSIRQSDKGWTMHDVRSMRRSDTLRVLSGDYAVAGPGAHVSYLGTDQSAATMAWHRSSVCVLAPADGRASITTDSGTTQFNITASDSLQWLRVDGQTASMSFTTDIPGLVAMGAYLDGNTGVAVDCMAIRGNAGYDQRRLNAGMVAQMRAGADYDLIIVEYGTNAVSAEQTDYTSYMLSMTPAIDAIKRNYPRADIIIMGIADRGEKSGVNIKSMPVCTAMVKAQRELARRTHTHFWDTRAAMGGDNAVVRWRKDRLINADYTHLNHDGGRELASLLYQAICDAIAQ